MTDYNNCKEIDNPREFLIDTIDVEIDHLRCVAYQISEADTLSDALDIAENENALADYVDQIREELAQNPPESL